MRKSANDYLTHTRKRICLTKVCETAILRNRYKGVSRDGYVFFHFKRETEDGI